MDKRNNSVEKKLNSAIFSWINIPIKSKILGIHVSSAVCEYLEEKGHIVEFCECREIESLVNSEKVYDVILGNEVLERAEQPIETLKMIRRLLLQDGILFLGTDNRLGLRYFCGDIDPSTERPFTGLEQYNEMNNDSGWYKEGLHLFTKSEILEAFALAGFARPKFYSVLPNLAAAQLLYAEDYLPEERLATRYIPMYRNPDGVFLREEWMYDSIIKNGMFHQMANSYLIEYHANGQISDVMHVTLSADRGEENSCATIIYKDRVEKKALYSAGEKRLIRIKENDDDLAKHFVPMIASSIIHGIYTMPYMKAEILEHRFQSLLNENVDEFIKLFDRYRDIVYNSSDIVAVDERGPILRKCYIDLVPLNCFYVDGEFVFYDQEFFWENEPANLILWRATIIIYDGNPTLNAILPIQKLWERYGIEKYQEEYSQKAMEFIRTLRNQEELKQFNKENIREIEKVMWNKRRVEHILMDWEKQKEQNKETCFDDLENKEIYVWGTGRYADEFICMYQYDYNISAFLDNSAEKHGTEFYGVSITSPEILREKNPETYKVIVCVKNCIDILEQLYDLGARYVGVYDINYVYPGRQKYLPGKSGLKDYQKFYNAPTMGKLSERKKYHIGYIAGVFDLYHLGHLNMFRRAKELCDYLIVGVVSDEGVRINKKKEPFIPFMERIEMVRSCKYVDEAVEIPFVYCRTPEAFRKYHFDVQFSGSDYEHDPGWLAMKDFLEQNGATMVFFPYTEQTSSTKIKSLIDKGLL